MDATCPNPRTALPSPRRVVLLSGNLWKTFDLSQGFNTPTRPSPSARNEAKNTYHPPVLGNIYVYYVVNIAYSRTQTRPTDLARKTFAQVV